MLSSCKIMKISFDVNNTQENWSFQEEKDQKIIECDEELFESDEILRKAYWFKDWHILIMTNERILILDINLNVLTDLGQLLEDFDSCSYSWNLVTESHEDCFGFIISSMIHQEPKRTQFKSEFLSPWIHVEGAGSWIMRVRLNK